MSEPIQVGEYKPAGLGGDASPFEEFAPDDIQRDLCQCNRTCRQLPRLARIGTDWIVSCLCSRIADKDMLNALLVWNNFNPIRRITPSAKLAALRALNKQIAEKS